MYYKIANQVTYDKMIATQKKGDMNNNLNTLNIESQDFEMLHIYLSLNVFLGFMLNDDQF